MAVKRFRIRHVKVGDGLDPRTLLENTETQQLNGNSMTEETLAKRVMEAKPCGRRRGRGDQDSAWKKR